MAERFFRDLSSTINSAGGVFRDLEELIMTIENYIDRDSENSKPFVWTASAGDILEKRARRALNKRQSA